MGRTEVVVDGGDATVSKRDKDILQAGTLIEALSETRKAVDLADGSCTLAILNLTSRCE